MYFIKTKFRYLNLWHFSYILFLIFTEISSLPNIPTFTYFRRNMPVPMEEIVEELGAALDARYWLSPIYEMLQIVASSNPGLLQHLLSLMPQRSRKRRPLPGNFQMVNLMLTQYFRQMQTFLVNLFCSISYIFLMKGTNKCCGMDWGKGWWPCLVPRAKQRKFQERWSADSKRNQSTLNGCRWLLRIWKRSTRQWEQPYPEGKGWSLILEVM